MFFFKELLDGFLDLLYPQRCLFCNSGDKDLFCKECINKIDYSDYIFCIHCGKEFSNIPEKCPVCSSHNIVYPTGFYRGILKDAICKFKYEGKISLQPVLGELMFRRFIQIFDPADIDLIVPIPLHLNRQRLRSFSQTVKLVENLSFRTSIPYLPDAIIRIIDTPQQMKLPLEKRITNVKGAFKVNNPSHLKGKNILLLDDVLATGSRCC